LNRETSAYLDLVRFGAAMTVFLGHVAGTRFTGGLFWQTAPYTSEAVTVFFVISGFAIGYAADRQEQTPRAYVTARLARVYSVALPALLLTFALDAVGRAERPDLYVASWGYVGDGRIWQFLAGLLLVNQAWFLNIPQGSNLAYWSLGYEAWYYAAFGVAAFAPSRYRIPATIAVLVLAGPDVAAMFPLWLLGFAAYRLCAANRLKPPPGALLYAVTVGGWAGYEAWAYRHGRLVNPLQGFLRRPELAQDYVVGGLFAASLVAFRAISPTYTALLGRFARPIRWVAGASFSLYLFHLPVAQFLTTQLPCPPGSWTSRVTIIGGTLVIVFGLAEVTERRKAVWRRAVAAVLAAVAKPPAAAARP
jgi:peptidoglycan/LPS O-acetylase OafA/YrhL